MRHRFRAAVAAEELLGATEIAEPASQREQWYDCFVVHKYCTDTVLCVYFSVFVVVRVETSKFKNPANLKQEAYM